eukprot:CAMPEP_0202452664 /NCGR_PEP_ID=MMETSP1360-20130828/10819_1 /ASSEMBLY_ACC=CAM_ASM_000848 /TAXON_ID=515479 /ORGANISM="Licmophora paradoxa, Strain CCMP2313" /LENGTH=54 /DNA_ID=CAMNT_0049071543 /DNA_START=457 /DNA_END=621 /DNA_ORIENTATION=+
MNSRLQVLDVNRTVAVEEVAEQQPVVVVEEQDAMAKVALDVGMVEDINIEMTLM